MAYTIEQLETKAALIEAHAPNSPEYLMILILIEMLRTLQSA